MEEEDNNNYDINSSQNFRANYDQASVLELRLDTSKIIEQIKAYLEGKIVIITPDAQGNLTKQEAIIGLPKANQKGIQSILSMIISIFNPQVVQANFTEEGYYNFIDRIHGRISQNLMINLHEWGIKIEDYSLIMGMIIDMLEPFLTRTIGNKERESYEHWLRTNEVTRIEPSSGGGWRLPFSKS